jgi:GT2 family glycosyltransferase
MDKKVSIVITAFKDRGYLHSAIQSALNQDYKNVEVILASDGDRTLKKYATQYKIKYACLGSRKGLSANFNNGVSIATGEYIKILPDDDILPPNCVTDLVRGIENQKVDFVFANAKIYMRKKPRGWRFGKTVKPANPKPSFSQLVAKNHIHGGTTMYKKSVFDTVGGYDVNQWTGEELEFHIRLLSKGYTIGHVNKVVFWYRIHPTQKSGTPSKKLLWSRRVVAIKSMRDKYRKIIAQRKAAK